MNSSQNPVVIVGAGLAGLSCAVRLHEAGVPSVVIDKGLTPGGRVSTDGQDGFLLDRGFQVFLDAYPYASELLDLETLDLCAFGSGAIVWDGVDRHEFFNPLKHPSAALQSLQAPVGSWSDKFKAGIEGLICRPQKVAEPEGQTTADYLASRFSDKMRERFLQPFFRGIYLDPELSVDVSFFHFLFGLFSKGAATIPRNGMAAIPEQLAARLPEEALTLGQEVVEIADRLVCCADGTRIEASEVVVAVEGWSVEALTGEDANVLGTEDGFGTICLYFALEKPHRLADQFLVLNGSGSGIINNLCFPSEVSSAYAPEGKCLCSVSLLLTDEVRSLSEAALESKVRAELIEMGYDGAVSDSWKLLARYHIPHALPPFRKSQEIPADGAVYAGDYLTHPSIEGALLSGRSAAQEVLRRLGK